MSTGRTATRRITKLRINEVSLVGEGDNPHADVLILKHRQAVGVDFDVAKSNLAEVRTLALTIAKTLSEGGSTMDIQELQTKLEGIEKALETAQTESTTQKARITELEGELDTVTKARDAALTEVEKAKAEGGTDEDVLKGVPKALRERIEKSEKRAADLEEAISKERDEREELQEIEKVKAVGLTDADKYGKLLHRVRKGKSTPEDADALSELLTKAKAVQKGGEKLFVAIGKASKDGSQADGAQAQLDEAIANIQKAKPQLTREMAYSEAIEANPDLYEQVSKIKPGADA